MRDTMRFVFPALCFSFLLYLCFFQVGNTDFWWHIKAGQLLRESGWIVTDPFAYTRAGEAYIANHEWLAQVILSFVYDIAGSSGVIALRTLLIIVTFGVMLLLDRQKAWINTGLVLLAAILARPALTDRPQLFTFLMFSIVVYLCLTYAEAKKSDQKKYTIALPIIFVLWSNLHGAAGITGIAVLGALGIQRMWDRADRKEVRALLFTGVLSCLALIATPSGIDNVMYAVTLMGDRTTELIAEWQSVSLGVYVKHVGIFWLIALLALWKGKRSLVFSVLVLFGIGYLSKSAVRHEVLFLIAALGITIHQLKHTHAFVLQRVTKQIAVIIALLFLGISTYVQSSRINMRDDLFGLGAFTPLKGASEFIHQKGITGNMFNNYNAGGELLFRGHKVFLDGRNLDYGYAYITRAVEAGESTAAWDLLSSEYNFTHAVVYYSLDANAYIDILQQHPDWGLSYLDDWAAVYVKGEEDTFTELTPNMLLGTRMPEEITLSNLQLLQNEVNSILETCPECTKTSAYKKEMLRAFGG
jgi:hypothetical protein